MSTTLNLAKQIMSQGHMPAIVVATQKQKRKLQDDWRILFGETSDPAREAAWIVAATSAEYTIQTEGVKDPLIIDASCWEAWARRRIGEFT